MSAMDQFPILGQEKESEVFTQGTHARDNCQLEGRT